MKHLLSRRRRRQGGRRFLPFLAFLGLAFMLAPAIASSGQRHADPALETFLPSTLGGVTLVRESQSGTDLTRQSQPFDAFLAELGKTRSDFTVASAYATSGLAAEIGAWHVSGLSGEQLLPGFRTALQASSSVPLAESRQNVGGRTVLRLGDPGQMARGPLYVLPYRDYLLFVQTSDEALAGEAIGKFPQ